MGNFLSTNYRDITLCTNIEVNCGAIVVEEPNTQIENRPDASSDQEREISQVDEDIPVRNSDQVTSDDRIEERQNDSSYEREDKLTQGDEEIAVQEFGQVTLDEQIEETSNDSFNERNDKPIQVDEDIAEQEPCQVTSNGQTDRRSHESSDQVRDNSGDDLIDFGDSSVIHSEDSDASIIQFETKQFVIRQKSLRKIPRGSSTNHRPIWKPI